MSGDVFFEDCKHLLAKRLENFDYESRLHNQANKFLRDFPAVRAESSEAIY